jgi:serine/threonine protein kinase
MEYLEGETLDDVLARRKRLPPQEAVRLVHQALLGLQHLHEQNMVHRDVKPANLMLAFPPGKENPDTTAQATVKILDIGLGRSMFEEDNPSGGGQDGNLTAEGVILGTPDYLAPEQARDPSNIDIRADIYSLGCVLYHCLTGQPPFPDKNILNQMVRHATETPRPLKDFNPDIPDGLQQVINWMLAKQPEGRYPSPERAAQALQMFLLAEAAPATGPSQGQGGAGAAQRKYLSWLDELPQEAPAAPRAKPAAPPPSPKPQPAKKLKRDRKADVDRPANPVSPAAPASPPRGKVETEGEMLDPGDIDVELVPLPTPGSSAEGWLGFSQRDWLFLGIGAGAVLLVVLVGLLIAVIFRGGE